MHWLIDKPLVVGILRNLLTGNIGIVANHIMSIVEDDKQMNRQTLVKVVNNDWVWNKDHFIADFLAAYTLLRQCSQKRARLERELVDKAKDHEVFLAHVKAKSMEYLDETSRRWAELGQLTQICPHYSLIDGICTMCGGREPT